MKKVVTFFIIAVMSLVKAYAADTASLTVNVTDEVGKPLEGIWVYSEHFEGQTDAEGIVKFEDLDASVVGGQKVVFDAFSESGCYDDYKGEVDFTASLNPVVNVKMSAVKLTAKIIVTDEDYERLEGAWVTFMGKKYVTDETGIVTVSNISGPEFLGTSEPFTVYKDGYEFYEGQIVFEGHECSSVAMLSPAEATWTLKVFGGDDDDAAPVAGALVMFQDEEYTTNENGEVKVTGISAPAVIGQAVPFAVYKDGYEYYEGEADFTETMEAFTIVNLVAAEATWTLKVFGGDDDDAAPVADAWVMFLDNEYTTNENGEVKVTGISAPAVIGQAVPFAVYKDGYEYYEGEADFTETMEAFSIVNLVEFEATWTLKVFGGDDDDAAPIAGALVMFQDKEYTTNENGEVKVTGISAPAVVGQAIPFTVYKDGYEYYEGEADFTETTDAFSIVNLVAAEATWTLKVFGGDDDEAAPVAGALVMFQDEEYTTNENGEVKVTGISAPAVIGKEIPFTVYKDGYEYYEGTADFTETMEAFTIVNLIEAEASLQVKVITGEENDPVAGATVTFMENTYTTDDNGTVNVTDLKLVSVIGQKIPYSVYKDGYEPFEGEVDFTETMDAYAIATLVASKASLSIKVITGEENDPVAGATVTFMDVDYISDENGNVKIEDLNAPDVIGKEIAFTAYKDGYDFFEGIAIFDMLEAQAIATLVPYEGSVYVKVVTGEENDPVADAIVTFNDTEYSTNENGEVKISGLYGPDFIGKTMPITVTKAGYVTYTGEADFTETLDALVTVVMVKDQSLINEIKAAISDSKVFDLQGRQVSKASKGQVYIVNGRKVRL